MSLRRNIDVERLRAHHRLMHRIRAFEEQALRGLEEKVVLGAIHPSIGQEAIAAGICSNLAREDILLSTHRGHGHTLAKGADPLAMMREYSAGKGNCGARGSMHRRLLRRHAGHNGVVAANISIAAGAAHAIKLKKRIASSAAFSAMAPSTAAHFLRAQLGKSLQPAGPLRARQRLRGPTRTEDMTAGGDPWPVGGIGVPAHDVDGNDVLARSSNLEFKEAIRAGAGPNSSAPEHIV